MDIKISDVDEAMECLRHKNTQLEEDINKLKAELKKMPVFIQD
jgi:prefoldin subunit 5